MNETDRIVALDRETLWHPFTWIDSWMDPDFHPIVIASGQGAELIDTEGNVYLDGNSSIWTNIHGHNHPAINAAIERQLRRISHSSFLGLTNDVAPLLGRELLDYLAHPQADPSLQRVFFSDDGSTAMECALKIVWQYFLQTGRPERKHFISLSAGYHGDTVGAMSIGHSSIFHHAYKPLLFHVEEVMSPFCYRCLFNKAAPEKTDARRSRKCLFECVDEVARVFEKYKATAAAWVLEPRVQGAAGFLMHPEGYLARSGAIAREYGARVILDEVMTGFGRTGQPFAFHHEAVRPDVVALAKGITGGYLPLGATAVAEDIFDAFRGERSRAFYHGHSYTGNQLGCAAARENIQLLRESACVARREDMSRKLEQLSRRFWNHPHVGDVRLQGLILAIELVEDFATRRAFPSERRLGYRVCEQARMRGLLTRPVGDVVILMPPYCATDSQLERMTDVLYWAIQTAMD